AAAADESLRAEIEPVLADREQKGWMLRQPVQRIWAGERDAAVLTTGLDAQDSALVRQVLQLLDQ
ncbi:MAG: tetratricopeptide repeat protein, partial [Roseiflexaceae bacterium]